MGTNRSGWILTRDQNLLLALLLIILLLSYWMKANFGKHLDRGPPTAPHESAPAFVVEVEGRNVRQGIYTFSSPPGVEEILRRAGVVDKPLPRQALSLPLETGTKLILDQSGQNVWIRTEPMEPAKKILYAIPVDLNEIRIDELILIPGIGPTLAQRIVDLKRSKGRYSRLEELLEVSGIGKNTLDRLRHYLQVDAAPSSPTPE
jgi:competence protein ComEA